MVAIGYAGLGNMGSEISVHLAKYAAENGGSLAVWNRSKDKYPALKETIKGATFVENVTDLASSCDVIFLMVLNDAAATDVVTQISGATTGKILVDQSSVNPKTSIELEKIAKASGNTYLTACVFGRPDAAKAGKLIQLVAGEAEARKTVRPLLEVSARAVVDIGEEVYKGTTLKLMGNALILGVIEMLAETFALGDALNIDSDVFLQFVELFFPTPSYIAYGKKIAHGDFHSAGGFRLEGGLKDARNILSVGADLGHPVPMPTIALAKQNMERAVELGDQNLDWSSLAGAVREGAGLPPFKKEQK